MLYCPDDGNHTVRKFTPDGKRLMTLGTMNTSSDTGHDGKNSGTVSRPAGPFNRPTNLAVGPTGDYRPFHRPEHMAMLLDSLRKAGLPE